MVSAYDEDEYLRGALEAGAAGYLSKTAPGKELIQAVRTVVRGTSVLQSGLTVASECQFGESSRRYDALGSEVIRWIDKSCATRWSKQERRSTVY